jgi:hypothetical protein
MKWKEQDLRERPKGDSAEFQDNWVDERLQIRSNTRDWFRSSAQARTVTEMCPNQRSANGGREKGPEGLHRRYFWLLACAWTAAVAGSLAWNLAQHADEFRSLTVEAARALL